MIIFDYNQVAISNLMEQIGNTKQPVEENLVRHMILNTIRKYVSQYKHTHGPEVVIACDSKNYWRKEIFPYYKANRKKNRESSGHDWNIIFECLNKIRDELQNHSPYKVIEVESCEADDVISVLTQKFSSSQKIMIISSDKDFPQLQKFPNVEQYAPILKKMLIVESPEAQLKELIIRGDFGDGIPNILSSDDVLVSGERQKPIMKAKLENWLNQKPEEFCNDVMLRNYYRNEALIDLTKIPKHLTEKILDKYNDTKGKSKTEFMNYMINNRLKNLIEVIGDF